MSALLVGKVLEALERLVVGVLAFELDAELFQALLEGVAPRELAEHDLVRAPPHVLGAHDLVGVAGLEHAVLVDAGSVREGVLADHRLVRLDDEARDLRHEARGRHDLGRVDVDVESEEVLARAHGHHHFLERGVARALTQAVDGALDRRAPPICTAARELATAMPRSLWQCTLQHRLAGIPDLLAQFLDEFADRWGTA